MDMTEQWQMLAVELGFQFRQDIRLKVELPSMHLRVAHALKKGKLDQAARMLETPMMKSLLSKLYLGSATGIYHGFECAVFRSSSSHDLDTPTIFHVNIVLMLPKDLGLGLDCKAAGSAGIISKLLSSGKRLRFPNDPRLDGLISVETGNKKAAEALFANKRLVEALSAMYGLSDRFTIWDQSIRYDERGQIMARDRVVKILNLMVGVAEGLTGKKGR